MLKFSLAEELKDHLRGITLSEKTVGFVPTMGALHEGHFKLLEKSINENDLTISSIFVNPLQFNNPEDFTKYPRNFEADLLQLEKYGCDIAFLPSEKDFYKELPSVRIDFGSLAGKLEGEFRPDHFAGVGIVLTKLFHMVNPRRAYFGLKDLQQYLLVKKMVTDLSFDVEVVGVETIREKSGLALSSRNQRLSPKGITIASNIYEGLKIAGRNLQEKKPITEIKNQILEFYTGISGLEMEYLEIVDGRTLDSLDSYDVFPDIAVCVAGYVEGVRLIDNLYLRFDS